MNDLSVSIESKSGGFGISVDLRRAFNAITKRGKKPNISLHRTRRVGGLRFKLNFAINNLQRRPSSLLTCEVDVKFQNMKTTLIIAISIIIVGIIAYYVFFPKNTYITIYGKDKSGFTFSKTGVKYQKAPDYYPENGFDHLESYISKLLIYSDGFKSLIISTPKGDKALGLDTRAGVLNIGFTVEWKQEPEKEKLIRDYFKSLNIPPHMDYLAANGGVAESTRVLDFIVEGNEKEITLLVKDILIKLCDISETEGINFRYEET